MDFDTMLFRETETKSTTLTIRLSPSQKTCICNLAQQKGASIARFMLGLVGQEYERINRNTLSQTSGIRSE
jgi:uncharacterized protein (DUF1778 family)